jgi:RND superfamily putative drug exporter
VARLGTFFRRFRRVWWLVPLVWLGLALLGNHVLPSLSNTARNDSAYLPPGSPPLVAARDLGHISGAAAGRGTEFVVVAHGARPLTAAERARFARRLASLAVAARLGPAPATGRSPYVSSDGRTDFAIVTVHLSGSDTVSAEIARIEHAVGRLGAGVQSGVTGDSAIQHAYADASLVALDRTLKLTVLLIVLIMLVVFRSPVAPIVPLFTVGTSYVLTNGIVAWLGLRGFPVTNFTQIFLVAVMFGAGTDYSILLLARLREELLRHRDVDRAVEATMVGVGVTALVSALTLVLAFGAVYFARFNLYQSGVGVAVGVILVGVSVLLVVPALLTGLGGHLFWPFDPLRTAPGAVAEAGSARWRRLGGWAAARPAVALLPLLGLAALSALGPGTLSFDDLAELPPSTPAVRTFAWMQASFGSGQVLPVNLVLNDRRADFASVQGLDALATVSARLERLPAVRAVDGPTQPLGAPLEALSLTAQARTAQAGVRALARGLEAIAAGLARGGGQGRVLAASLPRVEAGAHTLSVSADLLVSGLGRAQAGSLALDRAGLALASSLGRMAGADAALATGAGRLSVAAAEVAAGSGRAAGGATRTAQGLNQAARALPALVAASQGLSQGLNGARAGLDQIASGLQALGAQAPALAATPGYHALAAGVAAESASLARLAAGADQLSSAIARERGGIVAAAGATRSLAAAIARLAAADRALADHLGTLAGAATRLAHADAAAAAGAAKIAAGEGEAAQGTAALAAGARRLAGGARALAAGVAGGASGAQAAVGGLTRATDGTRTAALALGRLDRLFLTPLAAQSGGRVLIPASLIAAPAYRPVLDAYVSPDGHTATLTVVLAVNPYGTSAMNGLTGIRTTVRNALGGTPFAHSAVYAGGTTAVNEALSQLSQADFGRTAAIVLAVIGVMLILLLRSIPAALYLLGVVTLNYFATIRIGHWVAVGPLGLSGLSWTVPFFSFLLLVALGVDYLIFYTSRFREEEWLGLRPALAETARMAGPVVLSAAAIMAGTFGSLAATGIASLIEIGIVVVIGLVLDTVVVMGLLVPAGLSLIGPILHWPFPARMALAPPATRPAAPGR